MKLEDATIVVTGGAGFIGSHLTDELLARNNHVRIIDNFSTGQEAWVPDEAETYIGDVRDEDILQQAVTPDTDLVIHLAASKQVDTEAGRRQLFGNLAQTHDLLEAMAANDVDRLLFASSSTVYGEAPRPTPEDYAPLNPTSPYGASKLACEGAISSFATTNDWTVWTVRFANVVGSRLRNAVIPDFITKLHATPDRLEILGNGKQEKSYLHIDDCVGAMCHLVEHHITPDVYTYNLGTETTTSVDTIADTVSDEMGLDPTYSYTGGEKGWEGDIPKMRLDISRLKETGWRPMMESDEAVRVATREILGEL